MKNCRPLREIPSAGRNFFIFLRRCYASTSCTVPNPPILRMSGAEIWAVDSFLRRATIKYFRGCRPAGSHVVVAECHRHSCQEPPIPPYRAGAEIWAVGFLFRGKQPLNILEVIGLRAPTAVETCHWHVSKSRLSNPTFRSKQQPSEWMAVVLAEKVGFEPTWRVTANSISSRARYDHFDTSPYRACLTGAYLFYHAMTENTSAFSEIVIIFISPEMHPADNGLPHSGKA